MKYLIGQTIAHISNEYNLLHVNQISGLKCREKLGTLMVLQRKIHQTWKDKKLLRLIIFNVQRAFNQVARNVHFRQIQKRDIPKIFMS